MLLRGASVCARFLLHKKMWSPFARVDFTGLLHFVAWYDIIFILYHHIILYYICRIFIIYILSSCNFILHNNSPKVALIFVQPFSPVLMRKRLTSRSQPFCDPGNCSLLQSCTWQLFFQVRRGGNGNCLFTWWILCWSSKSRPMPIATVQL